MCWDWTTAVLGTAAFFFGFWVGYLTRAVE